MPILKDGELDIMSHSAEQTRRLGTRLGALLQPRDIVCLSGDMGAGKTVFTAGIGTGWGTKHQITSPTYNLVHEHSRERDQQRLYHLDCYRLKDDTEVETIGLSDILDGDGTIVFEWPERIEGALPEERLWIEIHVLDVSRRNFVFEGNNARYRELIERFRETTFGV